MPDPLDMPCSGSRSCLHLRGLLLGDRRAENPGEGGRVGGASGALEARVECFGSDFSGYLGFICGRVVNEAFVWQGGQEMAAGGAGAVFQVRHECYLSSHKRKKSGV